MAFAPFLVSLVVTPVAWGADCNQNGIEDVADIANQGSPDCNRNGVPDECDLRARISFGPPLDFLQRATTRFVTAADLDGDAFAELITRIHVEPGSTLKPIWILQGASPDLMTPVTALEAGDEPVWITTADLDGDGRPDLAVANRSSDDISVILNRGALRFDAPVHYPAGKGPLTVTAVDLNGDRRPDLAAANPATDRITLLLNRGGGVFAPGGSIGPGRGPISLAGADLDGDGAGDLVAVLETDETVSVHWGRGDGTLEPPVSLPSALKPRAVIVRDLDQDDRGDLVVLNADSPAIDIFRQTGPRDFGRALVLDLPQWPLAAAVGDLDGNGSPDLAVSYADWPITDRFESKLAFFQNTGKGMFNRAVLDLKQELDHIVAADFDGDGLPDLAAGRWLGGDTSILETISIHPNQTPAPSSLDGDRDLVPDECEKTSFRRGDTDGNGGLEVNDPILVLNRRFLGGEPLACEDSADANDDGELNVSDPITILNRLFLGGSPLPSPGTEGCGVDPTQDELSCVKSC